MQIIILIFLLISSIALLFTSYVMLRIFPRQARQRHAILLDTSALIDGRILEVVRSGFMPSRLLIPGFVIAELQLLADKADHAKRERARYGLSVVQELQDSKAAAVSILGGDSSPEGVDEKLVELALKSGYVLYSTDFNLLKVAEIRGVRVLNINQLAQNLRPVRLPGERMPLKIVQKGQERDQGVAYLDDGTMVVVSNVKDSVGKTYEVEFSRSLQTAAGRMMFAEVVKPRASEAKSSTKPASTKKNSKKTNATRKSKTRNDIEASLIDAIDKQ